MNTTAKVMIKPTTPITTSRPQPPPGTIAEAWVSPCCLTSANCEGNWLMIET